MGSRLVPQRDLQEFLSKLEESGRHRIRRSPARFDGMEARKHNPGIGDTPVLPAPKSPTKFMSRHLAHNWWKKAEQLAGLEPKEGRGWHSLRRKFASDLMHKPLKVLSELGGWKNPQTILICYQHPDQDQLREALKDRRKASNQR